MKHITRFFPSVLLALLILAVASNAMATGMVTLCHKPDTPAEKTMTLPREATGEEDSANKHFGHGDTAGTCKEKPTPTTPIPATLVPTPIPTSTPEGSEPYITPPSEPTIESTSVSYPVEAPVTETPAACTTLACNPCDIIRDALANGYDVTINISAGSDGTIQLVSGQ